MRTSQLYCFKDVADVLFQAYLLISRVVFLIKLAVRIMSDYMQDVPRK